jgi:hypothetical protein
MFYLYESAYLEQGYLDRVLAECVAARASIDPHAIIQPEHSVQASHTQVTNMCSKRRHFQEDLKDRHYVFTHGCIFFILIPILKYIYLFSTSAFGDKKE